MKKSPRRQFWLRLGLALLPLFAIYGLARATGVSTHLDTETVRQFIAPRGLWALPLFVFLYGLGIVAHIPGSVFVGAGVLLFGPLVGGLASYAGACWGNLLSFGGVRIAGFRPPPPKQPFLAQALERIDAHPTKAVLILRVIFPTTAPINYALALSPVGFRPYIIGSLIGVLPQLVATILVFAAVFQ